MMIIVKMIAMAYMFWFVNRVCKAIENVHFDGNVSGLDGTVQVSF